MAGKLRPTERVLNNLNAIAGAVQALGATRGSGSVTRSMGGGGRGGGSRVSLTGGDPFLPMLQNLQAMNTQLAVLVQLTATGISGRDSLTRSSR